MLAVMIYRRSNNCMFNVVKYRIVWYIVSGSLVVLSILALVFWGLRLGIDFTGGSLLEVKFNVSRPSTEAIQESLKTMGLESVLVQPSGDKGVILRFKHVDEITHQTIIRQLGEAGAGKVDELRFETIGPIIGKELQRRSLLALAAALVFIVIYIAWAFRKVSRPVASWKYGLTAILALAHDTLITIGAFSVLGHYWGVDIDSLFVSALLTVIGFSVHDTIVVFDRTRENLFKQSLVAFDEIVNLSIRETLIRSINTSLTTIIVLTCLFLFGGVSIKYFSLALIIGITIGTYSSIFLASPLLVEWFKLSPAGKAKK